MLLACFIVVSAVLAASVGVVELFSRYRDDPFRIVFGSGYSWSYFLFNAIIGVGAFLVLWINDADVGPGAATKATPTSEATDSSPESEPNPSEPGPKPAITELPFHSPNEDPAPKDEDKPVEQAGAEETKGDAEPANDAKPETTEKHKDLKNKPDINNEGGKGGPGNDPAPPPVLPEVKPAEEAGEKKEKADGPLKREDLIRINLDRANILAQVADPPADDPTPAETIPAGDPVPLGNPDIGTDSANRSPAAILLYYSLAASFGGSLILRSRLITVRMNGQEIAIGPSLVIDQFLFVLDRQIDRQRAIARMSIIRQVMAGIDFSKAEPHVVNMIFSSLQNMTAAEREAVRDEIDAMTANKKLEDDQERAYKLGYSILNVMGEEFLNSIFDAEHREEYSLADDVVGDDSALESTEKTTAVKALLEDVSFEKAKRQLDESVLSDDNLSQADRDALRQAVDEIAATNQSDQEKAEALGFKVIDAASIDFFRTKFKNLRQ